MAKKDLRKQELLAIIKKQGMLSVKELADMIQVSEMTIRRDLRELEVHDSSDKYDLLKALQLENEKKEKLGVIAASQITDDDLIIIDTGSTTSKMLPNIPTDQKFSLLCYNANVFNELKNHKNVDIFFSGGKYHASTELFTSPEGLDYLSKFRPNKFFLSAAGLDAEFGITCANDYEVGVKLAGLKYSQETILLIDSSKFGQTSHSFVCDLSEIDTIITNNDLEEKWKQLLTDKKIKVIYTEE